jgi:uncharacterized protein (DUF1697 family)
MSRIVALLRGVNVGGRKLSMAALRAELEAAGCTDVATYIQSGNVVLTLPPQKADDWLASTISEIAGFDVAVVVRTARQLATTVNRNPYPDASGSKLHVVFYDTAPKWVTTFDLTPFEPEHCRLVGRDLYLSLPNGMGRAVLPVALEREAKRRKDAAVGTARNWNTVLTLATMVAG